MGNFKPNMIFKQLEAITEHHGFTINDPIKEFPEELMDDIMNGVDYPLKHKVEATGKVERLFSYDGLIAYLRALADEEESSKIRKWANQFSTYKCCPSCGGKRLNKVALSFKIDGHDISEVCNWSLPKLLEWIKGSPTRLRSGRRWWRRRLSRRL